MSKHNRKKDWFPYYDRECFDARIHFLKFPPGDADRALASYMKNNDGARNRKPRHENPGQTFRRLPSI